jgi:DNA-binding NtrC family response regulator
MVDNPRRHSTRQSILAVDDEPHMLRMLERFMSERTSYEITTTNNSLEVPELLDRRTYDLIITDLRMPGLDGMGVLRLVKESERPEEVIIITAFGTLENAAECLALGAFAYLTKPFSKEQIVSFIHRAMQRQDAKRAAARMDEIFGIEPFSKASETMQGEYVRRLFEVCSGDEDAVVARSGLPPSVVRSILENE